MFRCLDAHSPHSTHNTHTTTRGLACVEETDFGQSRFGHPDLTNFGQSDFGQSNFGQSNFGQSDFGQSNFGQSNFGQSNFGQSNFLANIFGVMVGPRRVGGQTQKKWGPEGWSQKGGAPKGGGPKIWRFFFPLPPQFSFFFHSLLVFFVEFWWCLKRRCVQMCTFGLSGCRVKPRQPHQTGPPGLAHDNLAGEGKKRAKFWAVRRRGVRRRGPAERL